MNKCPKSERNLYIKKEKTATNRECLNSLNDAELAGYLSTINNTDKHPETILEWLKQPKAKEQIKYTH